MSSSSDWRRAALATPAAVVIAAGVITGSSAAAATDVPDRWEAVVDCESGGDPNAVNPSSGAAGLYQILESTWDAHGGEEFADTADAATPSQQLIVAERVLESQGPGAWVCGGAPGSSTPVSEPQPEPQEPPEPAESSEPEPAPEPAAASEPSGNPQVDPQYPADNHVVQPGDTLSALASEHGTSVAVLVDANPRTVEDPDVIYESEGLYIP